MSKEFEQIVEYFVQGSLTLEAVCALLTQESQQDPARTRFWGQRIETEMRKGRVPAAAARAMLDALEGFQSDKTMWLDPSMGLSRTPPTDAAPMTKPKRVIATTEQLRATLFAPATRPRATPLSSTPRMESSEPVVAAIPIGTVIKDRYRLVANLGAGGVGQVFDAIDLAQPDETHVTLKIVGVNLKHEPYALDALKEAVRRTQHLEHPNIVRVNDIGQHEHHVFITMEPLRGRWLSGMVREARHKGMPYQIVWPIVEGMASGLAYAHKHGIVHSDLSPHSVFVCEDGTAKIVGFGLVHAVPASNESLDVLDTLTLRAYTEAYTADVWAQHGTPNAADDLYPLGVIAYEMLTGVHPFQRCSLTVARQKDLTFDPIPGLNRRALKLIERCLSFERETRPKNGEVFVKRMRPGLFERLLSASA